MFDQIYDRYGDYLNQKCNAYNLDSLINSQLSYGLSSQPQLVVRQTFSIYDYMAIKQNIKKIERSKAILLIFHNINGKFNHKFNNLDYINQIRVNGKLPNLICIVENLCQCQ